MLDYSVCFRLRSVQKSDLAEQTSLRNPTRMPVFSVNPLVNVASGYKTLTANSAACKTEQTSGGGPWGPGTGMADP